MGNESETMWSVLAVFVFLTNSYIIVISPVSDCLGLISFIWCNIGWHDPACDSSVGLHLRCLQHAVRRSPERTDKMLVPHAAAKPNQTFILKYGAALSFQPAFKCKFPDI